MSIGTTRVSVTFTFRMYYISRHCNDFRNTNNMVTSTKNNFIEREKSKKVHFVFKIHVIMERSHFANSQAIPTMFLEHRRSYFLSVFFFRRMKFKRFVHIHPLNTSENLGTVAVMTEIF